MAFSRVIFILTIQVGIKLMTFHIKVHFSVRLAVTHVTQFPNLKYSQTAF